MSLRAWLRGPLLGAGLCLATVSAAVKLAAAQCPLIYGETQFPDAFEPVTTLNNMPAVRVSALLFASLVRFDEFREAQPCLAESWTLLPGGRQIRFRLRPGLVWHDGQPLQASDVKFTLDLFRRTDSFIGPYYRHKAQAFLGATVLGDLEIEFEFVQPAPTEAEALSRCRFPILPEHVLRGPGLKRASSFSTQKPVGSGPYYLAEIAVAENRVTLHANPRYFARPQIEEIVMRKRANQELLTLALQGGGLDFIADISPNRLQPFYRSVEFEIYPFESLSFEGLGLNLANKHLANPAVRQALLYGTDRQRILDEVYDGRGQLLSGPFAPTSYCFCDTVAPYPYQPSRARQLLTAAGYADRDGDGILESPLGSRLSFVLKVAAHDDASSDYVVCQRISSYLREVGIQVEVAKMTRDDFEYAVHRKRDFDMAFFAWAYDEGSNVGPLFITDRDFPEFDKNYGGYQNPQFEAIYQAWVQAADRITAQAYGWEMHRILAADLPYLFLWHLEKYAIATRALRSVSLSTLTTFDFVENWAKECE